jgi:hypothetical protein
MPETCDRIPDDRQSKARPIPRSNATARQSRVILTDQARPSLRNRSRRRLGCAGFSENFSYAFRAATRTSRGSDKAPRTAASRGKSLRKIARFNLWQRVWITMQLLLCLIEQPAQLWARPVVLNNALPLRVASQFRKQRRNMSQQLVPFGRRQCADRLLDLTRGAHCCLRYSGGLSWQRRSHVISPSASSSCFETPSLPPLARCPHRFTFYVARPFPRFLAL